MCGLCGIFSEDAHWASRLDAGVGRPDEAGNPHVGPAVRRLARARRIAVLNRMLAGSHVRVSDWQGSHYRLEGATGKTELVDGLGLLWPAIERMRGRPFDPLEADDVG